MKSIIALLFLFSAVATLATSPTKVHFVKPHENEVVSTNFPVEFAVEGMAVAKAGVLTPNTGHHHLIIDGKPVTKGEVVPKNGTHLHFGDGSTSTTITLKPGKHTLTMQFADGIHKSLGEEYSATVNVEVK